MSLRLYVSVFGVLIAATVGELSVIRLPLPSNVLTTSLIGSAGVKAILIAMFFQHLKDEPKVLSSLLFLGLIAAVILTTISFLQLHVGHITPTSILLAQSFLGGIR